jgi:hypothetical protein
MRFSGSCDFLGRWVKFAIARRRRILTSSSRTASWAPPASTYQKHLSGRSAPDAPLALAGAAPHRRESSAPEAMASLEWFRSTLTEDAPPDGLSPPLQALWYAGKTEFNVAELFEIFDRIGGNGTAVDGTVYAAGTSPPPEAAGPEVRDLRAAIRPRRPCH